MRLALAGSQRVAELLAEQRRGKVFLEDAGFDWKILGPDVSDVDYVAWQCDQDAYACSGQKCSAQSIMFMHENWQSSGLLDKFRARATARSLDDLTVGPVLTLTTAQMLGHVQALLKIPGAPLRLACPVHAAPPRWSRCLPVCRRCARLLGRCSYMFQIKYIPCPGIFWFFHSYY